MSLVSRQKFPSSLATRHDAFQENLLSILNVRNKVRILAYSDHEHLLMPVLCTIRVFHNFEKTALRDGGEYFLERDTAFGFKRKAFLCIPSDGLHIGDITTVCLMCSRRITFTMTRARKRLALSPVAVDRAVRRHFSIPSKCQRTRIPPELWPHSLINAMCP